MPAWKIDHLEHGDFMPTGAGADIEAGSDDPIATFSPDNLQFTLQLGKLGPGTISYEVGVGARNDLDDTLLVAHEFVGAYRTDFRLRRGDLAIMEGMHTPAPSMSDEDRPVEKILIAGQDFLHYLQRRMWPYDADLSYVDWPDGFRFKVAGGEIGQIVKDILETVRDVSPNWPAAPDALGTGGGMFSYGLGYTLDIDNTAVTTNYEISAMDTTTIYDLISALAGNARGLGGFDFGMSLSKVFYLRYPELSTIDSPVATIEVDGDTFRANARSIGFTNDGPQATHFLGMGAGTSGQAGGVNRHFRANSAVYRRLDDSVDYGDVKNLTLLENLTGGALSTGANPIFEIPIVVNPADFPDVDFWNTFQPGVYVTVNYDLLAHALASAQKIVSMDCTVSQEGDELVTLGFNRGDQGDPSAGLADP